MPMTRSLLILILSLAFAPGCSTPTPSPDLLAAGDQADTSEEVAPVAGPYDGFVASGATIREMLGVSTHMSRSVEYSWKREAELDRLEELGFTRVRSDFYWKAIEAVEGVYDVDGPAHMTDLCLARGFEVLGILLIPPPWAQVDGTFDSVDPEKWRAYVRFTVETMKDRVHSWEIWNEQNLHVFWTPAPNPYKFGTFLKIAAEEIRALDPDAEIVFGGLSPFQFHTDGIWAFIPDVAKHHPDICDAFDSLAIHPYSFAQQESPEAEFVQGAYVHPPMTGLIDEARVALDAIGCPGRPIHLTEAGWPDYYMGVEKQGAYAVRGLLQAAAAGASTYYWYTFWDSEITPDTVAPTEHSFGLMTWPKSEEEPGERKPSFNALKEASAILGDSRYAGDLARGLGWEEHLHALVFVDGAGQLIVAAWHSLDDLEAEVSLEIPVPGAAVSPISVVATGFVTYVDLSID